MGNEQIEPLVRFRNVDVDVVGMFDRAAHLASPDSEPRARTDGVDAG